MKKSLCIAIFSLFAITVHAISSQSRKKKDGTQVEKQGEVKPEFFVPGKFIHPTPSQIM